LIKDIATLAAQKAKIDKSASRKTGMLYSGFFAMLLAELGGAYYMIYEVSWLGWDLLEPLTYSIAQFYFICGLYFYCRNQQDTDYKNVADFLNNHFKNKMYKKKGFEIDRLNFLKKRLTSIDQKINELEHRKTFS